MTDNEKRAHDLAVASIRLMYDVFVKDAENYVDETGDVNKKFVFNVFEVYQKAYSQLLEEFNNHYPKK